jgi:hypothetical protein
MKVLPGVRGRTLLGVGLGGVALGLGVGAINGYVAAKQRQEHRQALRTNLERVIQNPTNINAVGVLATGNIRANQFSSKDAILNRVHGELSEFFRPDRYVNDNYHGRMEVEADLFAKKQELANAEANLSNRPN